LVSGDSIPGARRELQRDAAKTSIPSKETSKMDTLDAIRTRRSIYATWMPPEAVAGFQLGKVRLDRRASYGELSYAVEFRSAKR
jgi:hypothetical protein